MTIPSEASFKPTQASVLDQSINDPLTERSVRSPLSSKTRGETPKEGSYVVNSKYCKDGSDRIVRLSKVRFALQSGWIDLEELREIYRAWVAYDEGFVIQATDHRTFEKKTVGVKCSKRGNDVYRWRVQNRFKELEELTYLSNLVFFKLSDLNPKSPCLFITFTYDAKRCKKEKAWENIGVEFNRALSWLRRRYGALSVFRAWEAFESGYPHIHAVIFFREAEFKVFFDKAGEARVQEKGELEGSWHSFIDVTAVQSLGSAMRYLVKYLSKVHNREEVKHETTLAMMWLYRKRAFGLSGEFLRDLKAYRLERVMQNSNKKMVQLGLDGVPLPRLAWEFLGLCSWKEILELRKEPELDLWVYELDGVPKGVCR